MFERISSWITGRDGKQVTGRALTPEGRSLGFEWEMPATEKGWERQGSALLWPEAETAGETGPLAGINQEHPAAAWTVNGEERSHESRTDAMVAAENEAAEYYTEPLAEASARFHGQPVREESSMQDVEAENESNALTADGAARGLSWSMRDPDGEYHADAYDAYLWHAGDLLATIDEQQFQHFGGERDGEIDHFAEFHPFGGLDRGGLQERYPTLDEAMKAAERWAVDDGIRLQSERKDERAFNATFEFFRPPETEQTAEASEAFHARVAGELEPAHVRDTASFIAENPPAITEWSQASESFFARMAELSDSRTAEADRGAERDTGLER